MRLLKKAENKNWLICLFKVNAHAFEIHRYKISEDGDLSSPFKWATADSVEVANGEYQLCTKRTINT